MNAMTLVKGNDLLHKEQQGHSPLDKAAAGAPMLPIVGSHLSVERISPA